MPYWCALFLFTKHISKKEQYIYNMKKSKLIIIICIIVSIILAITFYNKYLKKYDTTNHETIQTSGKLSTYKVFVDVEESKLYLLENDEIKKVYECSGGKWSTPSPIGTWTIVEKAKWGEGFGGSWMRTKCTMGTIWNSRNNHARNSRLGKFSWMYKNEK